MQTIDDKDQEALIEGHLQRLRAIDLFARSTIVTIIEANLAWVTVRYAYLKHVSFPEKKAEPVSTPPPHAQASYIARVASKFKPIVHLQGDPHAKTKRVGVWMTNDIKEGMKRETWNLLDTERIAFSDRFISASNGMKGALCTQLRNYKYEIKPAKDAFSKPRVQLTGKSYNTSDDLCIVLQMICFWAPVYYQHPKSVREFYP